MVDVDVAGLGGGRMMRAELGAAATGGASDCGSDPAGGLALGSAFVVTGSVATTTVVTSSEGLLAFAADSGAGGGMTLVGSRSANRSSRSNRATMPGRVRVGIGDGGPHQGQLQRDPRATSSTACRSGPPAAAR